MRFKRFISRVAVLALIINIFTVLPSFADDVKNPLANIVINKSTVSEANGNGYEQRLTQTIAGGWIKIDNIDFGRGKKYESVSIAAATNDMYAGGVVSYYLDSLQNMPIAEVKISSTNNSWSIFTEQVAELDEPAIEGIHSLYIKTSALATCDATYFKFNELKEMSGVALPEDVIGSRAEEAVKKLVSFGIMNVDSSEKIDISKQIEGTELIEKALMLIKCNDTVKYSKFASYCGYNAEGVATIGNAARVMSYITGQGVRIKKSGKDEDTSYYYEAKRNDILKGITEPMDAALTRELLYIILGNMCDAEMLIPSYNVVGEDGGEYFTVGYKNNGETLVHRYFGITCDEGIVSGDDKTLLSEATSVGNNIAKINGRKYACTRYEASDYLGQNVEFYYNDDDEIVYMSSKDNEVTEVNGDDIQGFDGSSVSYFANDKRRSMKLSGDFSVIFNGRSKVNFDKELFDGCRSAVFIDNNKDGKADVVKITKAYNFVVSAVSGNKIYAKFGVGVIDYDKSDVTITNSIGKIYDEERISKISEWSVLSVSESVTAGGDICYDAVISTSSVFGTVNEIVTDNASGDKKICIGSTWYETDKDVVYENNNNISAGDDIKAYINSYGKIAVVCKVQLSSKYGFISSVIYDEESGDDENVFFKIFNEEGKFENVRAADRVIIDSVSEKNQKAIRDKIKGTGEFKGVFVIYTLNASGALKKVDLPYNKEAGENSGAYESVDSLHITAKDFTGRNRRVPMSMSGKVFYNADTKVFTIPYDLEKQKYFRVSDINTFGEDADYTIDAYQVRCDSFVSDAIVRRVENVGEEEITESKRLYFFNKFSYKYDENDGEVYPEIEYIKKGEMVKTRVDSDMTETVLGLNRGDGILFAEDLDGNITYIKKVYDRKTETYLTETAEWNSGRRNIGGTVNVRYANHFTLQGNDEVFNANTNETTIAIYDSQSDKLIPGSVSDIIDGTTKEPSKVFMRVYYGIPRSILIIR